MVEWLNGKLWSKDNWPLAQIGFGPLVLWALWASGSLGYRIVTNRDGSESRLGSDSTRTRQFLAGSDSEFIGESKLGSTRTRSWDSGVLGESMVTPEVTKQILSWPTLSHINLLHELKSTYFNFFEVAKIQQWSYSEDKMSQQPARPKISNWILSLTTYEQVNFYLIKSIWDLWLGLTWHLTWNLLGSQDLAQLWLDFSNYNVSRIVYGL